MNSALRNNPHISPRHHNQPLPHPRPQHVQHAQHTADCPSHHHTTDAPNSSSVSGHLTAEASRMLSAIAESDENYTTSHTGGMEPIGTLTHSPGGDSVTSTMPHGGSTVSSSAIPLDKDKVHLSPQRHSPSPVSFHAPPVVAPQDSGLLSIEGDLLASRKISPVPTHLLGEASRMLSSSRPRSPHAGISLPQQTVPTAQIDSGFTTTGHNGGTVISNADTTAFARSPLSRSPAPSRCKSPALRPSLSPGPSPHSHPTPPASAEVAPPSVAPPSASYATVTDCGGENTGSLSPAHGHSQGLGNREGCNGDSSRSPPQKSMHCRGAGGVTSPRLSPPRPQRAQRTVSPKRFHMPDSASMHVRHGGIVLPKRGDAGAVRSVDTHAPHELKVHCVTWNMGRMKVTSQLAVNLRGAFLGVPREHSSNGAPNNGTDTAASFCCYSASWRKLEGVIRLAGVG